MRGCGAYNGNPRIASRFGLYYALIRSRDTLSATRLERPMQTGNLAGLQYVFLITSGNVVGLGYLEILPR
jgi:hypothetical protein